MPIPTRQLMMSAALGAALAATPATAQTVAPMPMPQTKDATTQDKDKKDASAGEKKDEPKDVKELLQGLRTDIDLLKRSRDGVDDLIYGTKDPKTAADQGIMRRLSDLDARLKTVEAALNRIETLLKDPTRTTAAYPPGAAPIAARAAVRIINDYPTEMSMMVNGKSHRIPPGESRTVDVPVGSYTYELLHAGSQPKTATVKDGETVTLRIN